MANTEARVISEMANMDDMKLIRDDILMLMIEGEFQMCWELMINERKRHVDAIPEFKITRPFKLINAINPSEERRKQEHNRKFGFDNYQMFN